MVSSINDDQRLLNLVALIHDKLIVMYLSYLLNTMFYSLFQKSGDAVCDLFSLNGIHSSPSFICVMVGCFLAVVCQFVWVEDFWCIFPGTSVHIPLSHFSRFTSTSGKYETHSNHTFNLYLRTFDQYCNFDHKLCSAISCKTDTHTRSFPW